MMAKQFRPPVSLSKLSVVNQTRKTGCIAVVATVVNDERLLVVPKMDICALKFSRTARDRIENVCSDFFPFHMARFNFLGRRKSLNF